MAKKEQVKLITPVFRGGFTNAVFEKKAGKDGGKEKYSLCAIWDPTKFSERDKVLWKALLAEVDAQCQKVHGMSWKECQSDIENFKAGLRDSKRAKRVGVYDGFDEGTKFATLSSQYEPGVVDINKLAISKEEGNTEEVYSGAYYRATVGVYAYKKGGGVGVALGLRNLQKVKDGERLDGRGDVGADFDEEVDGQWADQDEPPVDDDIPF